jgi:predicted RNase H-like HicB family nuclease
MEIPVLVERIKNNGYRAKIGEPLQLTARGATREEALAKIKQKLQGRLRNGTELVPISAPPGIHPLAKFAGMFEDDPYFDEVLEIIAENRRKMDRDRRTP